MKIILKFRNEIPQWLSERGTKVRFTSDFFDSSLKRVRVKSGEEAYILSNYVRENQTIAVQPTLRHYPIHECPISILEYVDSDDVKYIK